MTSKGAPSTEVPRLERPRHNSADCSCGVCETPLYGSPLSGFHEGEILNFVENEYHIDEEQFERMRTIAVRRAARVVSTTQAPLHPRGCGADHLLAYNRLWSEAIRIKDPSYFARLAVQQRPEYLYIGCSDSRVPANEIMGLCPGEIFVHRNVANIVSPSDLNMLSALQYSVEHLKVEHVIVSGHYKCGGVTAALHDIQLGLADHWVSHVTDVKKRHWKRMETEVSLEHLLDALCELNVLAQVAHLVDTHIVQNIWTKQTREEEESGEAPDHEIQIHGWIYGLEDGLIRSLITLTRKCNPTEVIADAEEAVFTKYRKEEEPVVGEGTAAAKEEVPVSA